MAARVDIFQRTGQTPPSSTALPMVLDFFRQRAEEGVDQAKKLADAAAKGKFGEGLVDAAAYTKQTNEAFATGLAKSRNKLLYGLESAFSGGGDILEELDADMDAELAHLRDKMDAGADFIVTQFFYDTAVFLRYVRRCREHGIRCPILPGIMPIQSYHSFRRMTDYCGVSVPPAVLERLEPVRDDDEAVKEIGCEIATEICETILQAPEAEGGVDGVHFYTLNLERVVYGIMDGLGCVA